MASEWRIAPYRSSDHRPPKCWAISQECDLAEAHRRLAWLGVGALLVTSHEHVVGLITIDGIRRARARHATNQRVADAMTDAGHIPLLGWQRVLQLTLSDVLHMFESTRTNHLVVVESAASDFTPVRGLIYRRQVLRQLGVFPVLNRGLELALANIAVRPPSVAVAMERRP
jgi:predicted transcriptional regulator